MVHYYSPFKVAAETIEIRTLPLRREKLYHNKTARQRMKLPRLLRDSTAFNFAYTIRTLE